jgi:hypothetical protein
MGSEVWKELPDLIRKAFADRLFKVHGLYRNQIIPANREASHAWLWLFFDRKLFKVTSYMLQQKFDFQNQILTVINGTDHNTKPIQL